MAWSVPSTPRVREVPFAGRRDTATLLLMVDMLAAIGDTMGKRGACNITRAVLFIIANTYSLIWNNLSAG